MFFSQSWLLKKRHHALKETGKSIQPIGGTHTEKADNSFPTNSTAHHGLNGLN
jgi:hypothetical protein